MAWVLIYFILSLQYVIKNDDHEGNNEERNELVLISLNFAAEAPFPRPVSVFSPSGPRLPVIPLKVDLHVFVLRRFLARSTTSPVDLHLITITNTTTTATPIIIIIIKKEVISL
ncbi:hypothetical protein O181_000476 [Austropuccinia psidii MF-1]|uniref:Uncharacterized protein n=1 Tax=Austropuccinia psidii MF-1 TaxID=1389203 RepID=A0A9Q3B954_9BASI|nr:hypothetical protein [Austropuccinia psidii MF-1]